MQIPKCHEKGHKTKKTLESRYGNCTLEMAHDILDVHMDHVLVLKEVNESLCHAYDGIEEVLMEQESDLGQDLLSHREF